MPPTETKWRQKEEDVTIILISHVITTEKKLREHLNFWKCEPPPIMPSTRWRKQEKRERRRKAKKKQSCTFCECVFFHFLPPFSSSFPTQTDNQISMTCLSPEKLDADVCAELAADSSSFQKLKKISLFSLQCFFFFSSTFCPWKTPTGQPVSSG